MTPLPRPHRSPHPCLYRDRPRPPRRCRPSCPRHCRGGRRRRGRRLIMTITQLRHKELFFVIGSMDASMNQHIVKVAIISVPTLAFSSNIAYSI